MLSREQLVRKDKLRRNHPRAEPPLRLRIGRDRRQPGRIQHEICSFRLGDLIRFISHRPRRECYRVRSWCVSGWLCRSTRCRRRASSGCRVRVGARRPRLPLIVSFGEQKLSRVSSATLAAVTVSAKTRRALASCTGGVGESSG
jgi:hypothetical protein